MTMLGDSLDTLVWLAHFPSTHGFVMTFIVGFALAGLLVRASGMGQGEKRLRALHAEAGQGPTAADAVRRLGLGVQTLVYRLLALVMIAGGALGLYATVRSPITGGYILEHGVETIGVYDGDFVRFTAEDGTEYVLPYDFFTAPISPADAYLISDEPVVVRYLENHPQAYMVDADAGGAY
ncbi:hypothetical protein ACXET9_06670 [Brachybacterium sp. DNPG3]